MYLKNEYSVFKGHPDFRPYKVSLTRILRFRVGLVGALWLSLQDYIRFVLIFSVSYAVGLGQKNTSLVSLITLSDLTFRAGQLDQLTGNTLQIMGLTLLFYFVMAQILVAVMRLVDRRFQPGRKKRKAA